MDNKANDCSFNKCCKEMNNIHSKVKYCYIQGPQGPRGRSGPTTIKIGETQTVESNQEAAVENVGTENDLILNFKIPKGLKGEKGEKGESSLITIPPAYGMRFLTSNQQIELAKLADTIISFNEVGPNKNTDYQVDNAIKINQSGFYIISYFLSGITDRDCTLTLSVMNENKIVPGSDINANFEATYKSNISNTIIAALPANSIITLNVRATDNITMSFDETTNATLTVAKIG